MSNINSIKLSRHWRFIAGLESGIADREKGLADKRTHLAKLKQDRQARIVAQLDKGETTGDPLQDSIIRFFGLNNDFFQKLLAFDAKLVKAKGEELLLVSHIRERVRHGAPDDECANDYRSKYQATLGILSGDHLQISAPLDQIYKVPQVSIPFTRHVQCSEALMWGSGHIGSRRDSPYSGIAATGAHLPYEFFSLILEIPFNSERTLSMFLGAEITPLKIGSVTAVLKGMRKVLNAPSAAEKV